MLTNNSDHIHQRMTDEPMSSSQTRITTVDIYMYVYIYILYTITKYILYQVTSVTSSQIYLLLHIYISKLVFSK